MPSTSKVLGIKIRHRGYEDSNNILLILHPCDKQSDQSTTPALIIHYVLVVCGIISGNTWRGFISRDRSGEDRLNAASTPFLTDSDYYFSLPPLANDAHSNDLPYAIVPSFSDWEFPHGNLPDPWKDTNAFEGGNLSIPDEESTSRSNVTSTGVGKP